MKRTEILGFPADALTYSDAVDRVAKSVSETLPLWILAVNPEKIIKANSSHELNGLLRQAELFIPDGVGILWAGRLMGIRFPERVTGADLFVRLVSEAHARSWNIYLLGAAPGIADAVAEKFRNQYPDLGIVGVRDGYFSDFEEEVVCAEIAGAKPDILFVAMGSPRQEEFIQRLRLNLNVPVCMGVGGSFDVIAGAVKRAPVWMQRTGLEWSYRLLREPRRIFRMAALPKFLLLVLLEQFRRKRSK